MQLKRSPWTRRLLGFLFQANRRGHGDGQDALSFREADHYHSFWQGILLPCPERAESARGFAMRCSISGKGFTGKTDTNKDESP
jgi:hypothetical protein